MDKLSSTAWQRNVLGKALGGYTSGATKSLKKITGSKNIKTGDVIRSSGKGSTTSETIPGIGTLKTKKKKTPKDMASSIKVSVARKRMRNKPTKKSGSFAFISDKLR